MNILSIFLNNEIRTGGHRRLLELCEDMAVKGHQVTVIMNRDLDYQPNHFTALKIACPYVRGKGGPLSSRFKRAVKSILPERLPVKIDILFIFGETHLKAALYLKRVLDSSFIYAQRSVPVQENRILLNETGLKLKDKLKALAEIAIYRKYETQIAKHSAAIIFQSQFDEKDFLSRNPESTGRTFIIPGHIGEPHYKKEDAHTNSSRSCRNLLFIGTLGKRKGLRYLIEAFAILFREGLRDLHLDILAPGEWSEWNSEILRLGIQSAVTYHGKVPNPFTYIAKSDLVIVPSTFDSFPNSVLEALHTGTPVIGSQTGGIPEMLNYPELLFPVQDSRGIATIIRKCRESDTYYQYLKQLCTSRTKHFHFDWTQKWLDTLSIIAEN